MSVFASDNLANGLEREPTWGRPADDVLFAVNCHLLLIPLNTSNLPVEERMLDLARPDFSNPDLLQDM